MKRYSYQGISRIKVIWCQVMGIFGIIFSTVIAIFTLVGIGFVPKATPSVSILNNPKTTLICLALWFLIIGWSVSMTFLNLLPTVWINKDRLYISAYLFLRIEIPWSAIIDIGSGNPPFGYTLVRARKITVFHRLFGWLYSRTLYPSFLIGKGISERNDLLINIEQNINNVAREEIK